MTYRFCITSVIFTLAIGQEGGNESTDELLKIGKQGLYGALGFVGLLIICFGYHMASKAWGNYKRRVKIKRRSEYLVK